MADLDAGLYDREVSLPTHVFAVEPLKFVDVEPFDVKAWAERKGVPLPKR